MTEKEYEIKQEKLINLVNHSVSDLLIYDRKKMHRIE